MKTHFKISIGAALVAVGLFIFCGGEGTPDYCGDGHPYNSVTQFCHNGETHDKCGGLTYNPDVQFCGHNELHDLCGGAEFDPAIRFCFENVVYAMCAGEEFDPIEYICENNLLAPRPLSHTVTILSEADDAMGGGVYAIGDIVMITAGNDPDGKHFRNWTTTSAGITFANANSRVTHFIMPPNDVVVTANFEQLLIHTITYNGNGHTGGTVPTDNVQYFNGAQVTVMGAGSLTKTNHVFGGWNTQADGNGNSFVADNTFEIRENTTLYARWIDASIPTYQVIITSVGAGASGDGNYEQGATVHINAGTPPFGQRFRNWTTTSAGVTISNATNATTDFIMPANAVTLTANFETIPTFPVTVTSAGTGSFGNGNYEQGETVTIIAGVAPSGMRFVNWMTTNSAVTFANANDAMTTFTMPASAVAVVANFELITYPVTVSSNGTGADGGGNYAQGATVIITAGTPHTDSVFKNWTSTSPGVILANASDEITTFTMPANAVTVTANFMSAQFNPNITYGTPVDSRDNQTYCTVIMPDGKEWMAQNLNYDTLSGTGSWCYEDEQENCDRYGRLYTWNTAMAGERRNPAGGANPIRGICPIGWRLPSANEWGDMVRMTNSMSRSALLKSQTGWHNDNNGTNEYGFSAMPSGMRNRDGIFSDIGLGGYWWTTTDNFASFIDDNYLVGSGVEVGVGRTLTVQHAVSVRCVK